MLATTSKHTKVGFFVPSIPRAAYQISTFNYSTTSSICTGSYNQFTTYTYTLVNLTGSIITASSNAYIYVSGSLTGSGVSSRYSTTLTISQSFSSASYTIQAYMPSSSATCFCPCPVTSTITSTLGKLSGSYIPVYGVATVPTTTPTASCSGFYTNIVVDQADLTNATGSTLYDNNTVYAYYYDSFAILQTSKYTVAGTYTSSFCTRTGTYPSVAYYANNKQMLPYSYATITSASCC